ncbi:GST5-like protein [Mya arenaria]|uniref:GST5-like protein n=1 Tax=Mya arenaria TaxID=6604 RepID=A0ABY7EI04_MYAAR|nr:GST5-like protein [Mya arenaria]
MAHLMHNIKRKLRMMPKKYELVYFDGRGRGENSRLLFTVAGVSFTDTRVTVEDWPKLKPETPQGTLPYLVIDGKLKLGQSLAIARYLAREFKLYGEDKLQMAFVDELLEISVDLGAQYEKAFFAQDEAQKPELIRKFKEEQIPKYFRLLNEGIAARGKNGFAVGSNLTLADLAIYNITESSGLESIGDYSFLKANRDKIEQVDSIAKYLNTRPITPF